MSLLAAAAGMTIRMVEGLWFAKDETRRTGEPGCLNMDLRQKPILPFQVWQAWKDFIQGLPIDKLLEQLLY